MVVCLLLVGQPKNILTNGDYTMKGTKFIKGYCKKTKQHFGLEIKQIGGAWKVVNFINISVEEASVITSEIKQSSFTTNDNLQACKRCGKRNVSGCSCPQKTFNCREGEYNFQCIYCNNMEIDYSASAISGGYKEGDVVRLSQGQEVKIHFTDNRPLTKIIVGVGWDPAVGNHDMDVDSSVIVAGNNVKEVVYFGDLKHPSGCVVHHGDNLTGEDEMGHQADDENITVYLDKVPQNRDRLIFVLNIYDCRNRHQQLGNVKNMYIRLYDPVSKKAIIEYKIDANMKNDTALVIGMAYRRGSEWLFKAIGKGSRAEDVWQLADEVTSARY